MIMENVYSIAGKCSQNVWCRLMGQSSLLIRRQAKSYLSTASKNSGPKMRFVQFNYGHDKSQRLGVQLTDGGEVVDLSGSDSTLPNNLVHLLRKEDSAQLIEKARKIVAEGKSRIPVSEVRLLAPVTSPDKILCIGRNYKDHCAEQNAPIPEEPLIFNKFPSCIVGPYDNIFYPPITKALDWEVELAVVIGKTGKAIPESSAMDHVFGYCVAQDVTARDWQKQRNGGQWLIGKAMDTFCPLGPCVVAKEDIKNPHDLVIRSWVNGQLKQDGKTSLMMHSIEKIIAHISNCCTLLPGDVILTGTPEGVGVFRNPPEFLKPGDVLESEVVGLGKLKNTIT